MEGEKLSLGAYRLLLHLQDRLIGVIETKEAAERFEGRTSGEQGKLMCTGVSDSEPRGDGQHGGHSESLRN